MEDVARVDERVRRLQTHFGQASRDIDDILVSTAKVTKRGQKIEALEFAEGETEVPRGGPAKAEAGARVADSKTGQLRLRVVEGDE
jgi:DNA recombination protein RmuC